MQWIIGHLAYAWWVLAALTVADAICRGGTRPGEVDVARGRPPGRGRWVAVLVVAVAVGIVRTSLSIDRQFHNVDEAQYAASADHVRRTGESLFGPRNLGGHQWLYLLGSLDDPYTPVDLATSIAVAATGFLLGLAILRFRDDDLAARIAPALYLLGMAPLEGGSANKEPWVGLCAAGWVLVRLRPGGTSWQRQLAGGACLGLAVLMKEQAGPLVLAEAALLAHDAWRTRDWRSGLRDGAVAAAGFWLGFSPLLVGLAVNGALGGFFAFLRDMGSHGGQPTLDLCRVLGVPPPPPAPPLSLDGRLGRLLLGLAPLVGSPVGFLGLWSAGRLCGDAWRAGTEQSRAWLRPEVGLAALGVAGVGAASIGGRWFDHYLLLAVPGLTGLAALRLAEAWRAVLQPRRSTAPLLLSATFAVFLGVFCGLLIISWLPAWEGNGLGEPHRTELAQVGAAIRRRTPPEGTLFVWGWRPELYLEAQRRPASRYVCGLTATKAEVMTDLRRERPAAIVLVGARGLGVRADHDPYSLALHADLRAWLDEEGYAPAESLAGYVVLTRPER